jgi:1-hydroxycarotenoid 3,4-desaturase
LVGALELAVRGFNVTVVERAGGPGGKMRETHVAGSRIDAGPTVFTMRWVFDEIFRMAGSSLDAHLTLKPAEILARHHWGEGQSLDLFADFDRSVDAIGTFAGTGEAQRYRQFCDRAARVYAALDNTFLRRERPTPISLTLNADLPGLLSGAPLSTLWRQLGRHFHDPRLRQLFGRYSTYCGSSPYAAPAILMLIAHVEQRGVWLIEGGMHRLALALADLVRRQGAVIRFGTEVAGIDVENGRVTGATLASGEKIEADAVVVNGDAAALAGGFFGKAVSGAVSRVRPRERSLSAVTWALRARTAGLPLVRHNVFFSDDYRREFDEVFRHGRLPSNPTVYVCAQDRGAADGPPADDLERLLCLVNAPAIGDSHLFDGSEIEECETRMFALLKRCGLHVALRREARVVTTPTDFDRLYPGTGGALYGRASHGWRASFSRPGSRTAIPSLYLAGGSTHPGAGVPMAALSGRLAAASILADSLSTSSFPLTAMRGGISTPSAQMRATG